MRRIEKFMSADARFICTHTIQRWRGRTTQCSENAKQSKARPEPTASLASQRLWLGLFFFMFFFFFIRYGLSALCYRFQDKFDGETNDGSTRAATLSQYCIRKVEKIEITDLGTRVSRSAVRPTDDAIRFTAQFTFELNILSSCSVDNCRRFFSFSFIIFIPCYFPLAYKWIMQSIRIRWQISILVAVFLCRVWLSH